MFILYSVFMIILKHNQFISIIDKSYYKILNINKRQV